MNLQRHSRASVPDFTSRLVNLKRIVLRSAAMFPEWLVLALLILLVPIWRWKVAVVSVLTQALVIRLLLSLPLVNMDLCLHFVHCKYHQSPNSQCTVQLSQCRYHPVSFNGLNGKCRGPVFCIGGGMEAAQSHKASKKKSLKTSKNKQESDPFEMMYEMLEKDLENGNGVSEDDDFSEEDFAALEKDLESVFEDVNATTVALDSQETEGGICGVSTGDNVSDINDEDEDEVEDRREVRLEKWQLRKLASALQIGRRKVNIKQLSSEVCLPRKDVLYFLQHPPLELLMLVHDDKTEETAQKKKIRETSVNVDRTHKDSEKFADLSVSEMGGTVSTVEKKNKDGEKSPRSWNKEKRIKKVHLAALELVYRRTKRPSNTLIENIVHITNLPRRRILNWFDERRQKDSGIADASFACPKPWRHGVTGRGPTVGQL